MDVKSESLFSNRVWTQKMQTFSIFSSWGVPTGARSQLLFGYRMATKETSFEYRQRQEFFLLSEASIVLLQHTEPPIQ